MQIDDETTIGNNVTIGARTRILARNRIGDNVTIGAGCFIHKNSVIRDGATIEDYTLIYWRSNIGINATVRNSGAPADRRTIGTDGLGGATIGDNVDIDRDVAFGESL